jgi:hypothetical protein
MIFASSAAWMLLIFGGADMAAAQAPPGNVQVVVRQRIVVRVSRPGAVQPAASMSSWREGRGPRCVAASSVAGASLLSENSVDLVMRDQTRVRARLESGCSGIEFYQGFYVNGTADGMICAERDAIRSRMGGQCRIDRFRSLAAVRP